MNLSNLIYAVSKLDDSVDGKSLARTYLDSIDPLDPIYINMSGTAFAPIDTKMGIVSVLRQKLSFLYIRENLNKMICLILHFL